MAVVVPGEEHNHTQVYVAVVVPGEEHNAPSLVLGRGLEHKSRREIMDHEEQSRLDGLSKDRNKNNNKKTARE